MHNAAVSSSGQLRWYSAQGGLFGSVGEACQAGFMTLQSLFDKINHLPNVKGPVVTVSMLATTSATYAGAPSFNCNYMIKGPQGAQQKSIGLAAVCASPGNVTPAPKSLSCSSINAIQTPTGSQIAQATSTNGRSASPVDSAVSALAYLQQVQNSFQGAAQPNDSRNDHAPAASVDNTIGSVSSSAPSPGIGSFKGLDVILTAYGCFRTGTIVSCDFDVTKQNSAPFKASLLWSSLGLKDDTGRVLKRHDAFFLADDGTRQPLTTLSINPVRLIIEFTGVDGQLSTASLVNGQDQISGVPIDMTDPGQPEGTIPARIASTAASQLPTAVVASPAPSRTTLVQPASAPVAKANPLDSANQAVDKVNQNINKANDAKQKAKSVFDALNSLRRK